MGNKNKKKKDGKGHQIREEKWTPNGCVRLIIIPSIGWNDAILGVNIIQKTL